MSETSPPLEQLVSRARELYSLPRVAAEVLELTNDPQIDARRLKQCIENDPALTAKLLRVVNSSLFGLSRSVSDLNQALALLGAKPLKLLVLGFCLPEGLFRGLSGSFLASYWQRTLVRAVAAREISQSVWQTCGDEAFLAGLLQELGVLALVQDLGEPYAQFVVKTRQTGAELAAAERATLGFDHRQLTARLLAAWQLPAAFSAVAEETDPASLAALAPSKRALPHTLHLAALLADMLINERPERLPDILAAGQQGQYFSAEQLDILVNGLQVKVQKLAQVLLLDLPDGREYSDILAEAHARLVQEAGEAAGALASRRPQPARSEEALLWEETRTLSHAMDNMLRRGAASAATAEPWSAAAPASLGGGTLPQACRESPARPVPARDAEPDVLWMGRLSAAAALCRAEWQPLSLLLVELGRYADLVFLVGAPHAERLVRLVEGACRRLDHPGLECVETRESCFAVIAPHCDRRTAVQLAQQLQRELRASFAALGREVREALLVSIGAATVALPPLNFSASEMAACAERCLFGARAHGGGIKSIEMY